MKKRERIRRGKGNKKNYFTKEHEDGIILYNTTDDQNLRQQIYKRIIDPVFEKLIEKVVLTYKFTNLYNLENLKKDCKSWLMTIIYKFDEDKRTEEGKKTKAFSYFTVVIRNWFIGKIKKQDSELKKMENIDQFVKLQSLVDYSKNENEHMVSYNNFYEKQESKEFWFHLENEMEGWLKETVKPKEKKVLLAVFDILSKKDKFDDEDMQKKTIYLYLREITGMSTKQVVTNLNKFRAKYRVFKERWDNNQIS